MDGTERDGERVTILERVKQEFLDQVRTLDSQPVRALEVGALPDERAILACAELQGCERIGVNLSEDGYHGGVRVIRGDARDLPAEDESFDLVVSNSTLEHIPDFWVAVAEMRRVLMPGGTLMLCMPGYSRSSIGNKLRHVFSRIPSPDLLRRGTVTMRVHDSPDCYRFGVDSFEHAILAGMEGVRVWTLMTPPRVFGRGRKTHAGQGTVVA